MVRVSKCLQSFPAFPGSKDTFLVSGSCVRVSCRLLLLFEPVGSLQMKQRDQYGFGPLFSLAP